MLRTVEKVLLLQDLEEFRLASTEHLAKLSVVAEERSAGVSTRLFAKGDPAGQLFLLVKGTVSLEGDAGSRQVEQAALDLCSVFAQQPHSVSARAVEPCVLLVISYDNLVDLLESEAEFSWAMTRYLARRIRAGSAERADSNALRTML